MHRNGWGERNGAAGGWELKHGEVKPPATLQNKHVANQELNPSSHFSFKTVVPEQTGIFVLVCLVWGFLGFFFRFLDVGNFIQLKTSV